jgi:hypothetical protein
MMCAKPGVCIISPRGEMPYNDIMTLLAQSGLNTVKFHIAEAFSTDPIDVKYAIDRGFKNIILRTGDGLPGYYYETVRDLFENPGSIAHYSYADLVKKHPDLNWWIEIGNEPNLAGIDPWVARWWSLAIVKELRINYLGHINKSWGEKYPQLHWTVSLPTSLADTKTMLLWLDNHGKDDIGDGSIIDYYDAISCHLYGDFQVISRNYDWPAIYDLLLDNKYVKKIHITEMGINDKATPTYTKCQRYSQFIYRAPLKVDLCTVWHLGRDSRFRNYDISDIQSLHALAHGS